MKIVILTTDTAHHRYFIKKLEKNGHNFVNYFFEKKPIKLKFRTGPFQEKKTKQYEKKFFKEFSEKLNNKKIIRTNDINNNKSLNLLRKIKPDLGIVFGTSKIDIKIIKLFKKNLINVHRGIINKYRGIDSELWAVYHSDFKNIGVAIHEVDIMLDSGRVYLEKKMHIDKETQLYNLRYHTTILATKLVNKFLNDYIVLKKIGKNQKKLGRYYSYMPLLIKKTLSKKLSNYKLKI